MLHSAGHPRRRRALPLVASLALGLAALPALGGVPAAHAARPASGHGHQGQAPKAPRATHLAAIHPFAIPVGSSVVTDCSTGGYANNAAGDVGLGAALASAATITFACNPTYGGFDIPSGHYIITVPQAGPPAFEFLTGEAASLDGSDAGKNDVTIDGGATVTATTATGGVQIFLVDNGASLALSNLTLQHGNSINGPSDGYGGAVEAFGNFTATNDVFRANAADFGGGALELARDTTLTGPTLDTLTNDAFVGNIVLANRTGEGGAIDIDSNGASGAQTVTVTGSTFTGNATLSPTSGGGGAIFYNNDSTAANLSIAGSVFDRNSAGSYGGAINLNYGNASIASSLFTRNTASISGALYNDTDTAYTTTLTGDTFAYNRATAVVHRGAGGGAIYEDAGVLNITNTTIVANSAASDGSAIYQDCGNAITVAASTINGNTTDAPGPLGGAAIVNAPCKGETLSYEPVTIGTSIVYGNVTNATPPTPGTPTNVVPAGTPLECNGLIIDRGLNLSDYDKGATNSCLFTQPPDVLVAVGTNIGLGALGAYGGPTLGATVLPGLTRPTYTERLLAGSPALDKIPAGSTGACNDATGAPLTTDQRGAGFVRPFPAGGNCDIGAFEASILTFGGPFGVAASSCSAAITFFSGGTAFALRTGSAVNTLMSYLSIKGPGGQITAVPLVPRAGVSDTLVCTAPDPAAVLSPSTATTVTVDAQVVRSTNPSVARLSTVRVVATRTLTGETVTVSAINLDGTTGATLYTLTPSVQPQSFAVRLGTFALFI